MVGPRAVARARKGCGMGGAAGLSKPGVYLLSPRNNRVSGGSPKSPSVPASRELGPECCPPWSAVLRGTVWPGLTARSRRAWVGAPEDAAPRGCPGQPGGAAPGREAQETGLIGPSARLHHIRGLGRAGGTRETLALQAPGSPASPRPACSTLPHPG